MVLINQPRAKLLKASLRHLGGLLLKGTCSCTEDSFTGHLRLLGIIGHQVYSDTQMLGKAAQTLDDTTGL